MASVGNGKVSSDHLVHHHLAEGLDGIRSPIHGRIQEKSGDSGILALNLREIVEEIVGFDDRPQRFLVASGMAGSDLLGMLELFRIPGVLGRIHIDTPILLSCMSIGSTDHVFRYEAVFLYAFDGDHGFQHHMELVHRALYLDILAHFLEAFSLSEKRLKGISQSRHWRWGSIHGGISRYGDMDHIFQGRIHRREQCRIIEDEILYRYAMFSKNLGDLRYFCFRRIDRGIRLGLADFRGGISFFRHSLEAIGIQREKCGDSDGRQESTEAGLRLFLYMLYSVRNHGFFARLIAQKDKGLPLVSSAHHYQ